jgi:circadian clock protein KaiB
MGDFESDTERFEAALAAAKDQHFLLRLYVVGASMASQRAIANLVEICEAELEGRYTLEVIDVYQQPDHAASAGIYATPTLVRLLPEPIARLVGDMSDRGKVVVGLDLDVGGSRDNDASDRGGGE